MQYALLIYNEERPGPEVGSEEWQQVMDAYNAFTKDIADRGIMRGGEALEQSTAATTVRVRNGKTLTTDGPFAETKEVLGGFYLVECKDLDEAIEVGSKIPGAQWGSVEVRPVIDFSQNPA
jgi:hypothetical protein